MASPVSVSCLCWLSLSVQELWDSELWWEHRMSAQHAVVLGEVDVRGWCPVCSPGLPSRNFTKQKAYPGNTHVGIWGVSGSGDVAWS